MDEPLVMLAWTLAGTLAFGLVGALFGGVSAWLNSRSGHVSGSGVGRRIAEALAQLREEELSDIQKGTLVGVVDGALFLGVLGTLVGVLAFQSGKPPHTWLVPLFVVLVALTGGAMLFGVLALGMVRLGLRAVVAVFVGGILGAVVAATRVGVAHIVPGAVLGLLAGMFVVVLLPR